MSLISHSSLNSEPAGWVFFSGDERILTGTCKIAFYDSLDFIIFSKGSRTTLMSERTKSHLGSAGVKFAAIVEAGGIRLCRILSPTLLHVK